MVYGGKPSTGCQMCKFRRVKCDEARPTCNNCTKSRRPCPGYVLEFDLMFRNETKATEMRAKKIKKTYKKARKTGNQGRARAMAQSTAMFRPPSSTKARAQAMVIATAHPPGSIASTQSPETTQYSGSLSPSSTTDQTFFYALDIPLEGRAFCHFLANFVLLPRKCVTRGFFEFLTPLVDNFVTRPAYFQHAFRACAFASLANRSGTGHAFLDRTAHEAYHHALAFTNSAVHNPHERLKDTMLATILLLGLFENVTATQMGMLSWGTHIGAATSILKERTHTQLETRNGLSLFIAVRTQLIIQSLSSGKPPDISDDFWIKFTINDENASHCQHLSLQAAELRAEVNHIMITHPRDAEHIEMMLEMIKKCHRLDNECIVWGQNVPAEFGWERVAWEVNVPNGDYAAAEVYPGRVDAYQDMWVASVWNMMRVTRIILASIVVRCSAWACAPIDYRTTPEFSSSSKICMELIADVIASVPYQLGWFITRKHLLDGPTLSGFLCGEEDAQKSLSGYFLTWPLACILGQDYCSDNQRTWVRGRLDYIGIHLGVRYAQMLALLNVRVPSMLIRRDGLMAATSLESHDFEHMLSHKAKGLPLEGYPMESSEDRNARRRAALERQTQELVRKAMGTSGMVDEGTARTWLQLNNL